MLSLGLFFVLRIKLIFKKTAKLVRNTQVNESRTGFHRNHFAEKALDYVHNSSIAQYKHRKNLLPRFLPPFFVNSFTNQNLTT
jgi:hypothetical protein